MPPDSSKVEVVSETLTFLSHLFHFLHITHNKMIIFAYEEPLLIWSVCGYFFHIRVSPGFSNIKLKPLKDLY